jgi:hypothetical protein
MGNINSKNFIKRIRITDNGNWDDGCSSNYVITRNNYKSGYLNPSLYPYTDFLLFPSALGSYEVGFWDNDVNSKGTNTIDIGKNKIVNGFAVSTRCYTGNCGDSYAENNHIFPLKYLNHSNTSSRVFNQKVYPSSFFSFTNTETYTGLSDATMSLDLSGFDYNSGEDWTTQSKIYVMKITETGVNGTGKFVLRSFPYIINNNEYETLPSGAKSMYSESVHVYENSGSITFMNTKGGLKDDFVTVTGLWAESRRKDPSVYDDFVCLLLEDANTLNVYDFHSPFLPTKEKTITLTNDTSLITWADGDIYAYENAMDLSKVNKDTETRTHLQDLGTPTVNYSGVRYIRDYLNGSTSNSGNHWVEIKAYTSDGTNVALSKTVTGSSSEGNPYSLITDGDTDTSNYASSSDNGLQYVEIDLESTYDLIGIQVWHYYSDGRTYHETQVDISGDGSSWTTIFDSDIDGEYAETSDGKLLGEPPNFNSVLVAHPDQDYVYLIGSSEQQVIDVSDDSVTTTTHDFSGYSDLMPIFDKDGNLWFSGDKYAKADLSSLYSHGVDAFCNYNFIFDELQCFYDLNGTLLSDNEIRRYENQTSVSTAYYSQSNSKYTVFSSLEVTEGVSGEYEYSVRVGRYMKIYLDNSEDDNFLYIYNDSPDTVTFTGTVTLPVGTYDLYIIGTYAAHDYYRMFFYGATLTFGPQLIENMFSDYNSMIKRYPQSWMFPYNQNDIANYYNIDKWFDSTGTEYDGSTNAYQIPASGEVTIEDGIKVIVDDNDGYVQVVEDDYFYFVVSGRGLVLDNWSSANIKVALNAWDYTEYTKAIVLSDTTYTITEAGEDDFIELNTLVVSGTWDDGSEITFTSSTPSQGQIQLNSNGTMTFNTEDMGRTATITYNVGHGV